MKLVLAILCLVQSVSAAGSTSVEFDTEAIQAFLEEHIQADRGYCMVVGLVDEHGGQVLSHGKLGNGTGLDASGDTLFEIGSVTKTFTALLLLEMVDRGEVQLDDPVAKYLPDEVTMPTRGGKEITLLNLAAQDSGLPFNADNMQGDNWPEKFNSYTVQMMYEFLSSYNLSADPGARYQYSNVGVGLLGHALARRANTDYESLVVERVCRPLGMDSTQITLPPELESRFAKGHHEDGEPSPNFELPAIAGTGALRSTANDLAKYVAAHLGLSPSRLTPLIEQTHVIRHDHARVRDQFEGQTALPWYDEGVYMPPGSRLLGHGGGTEGFNSFVGFDLLRHCGVVVLTNQKKVHSSMLGWRILQHARLSGLNAETMTPLREIVGIGTALDVDQETMTLRITGVVPGSPAAGAGLSAGLLIQRIDDVATAEKSLAECVDLLHGPAGAKVKLQLVDPAGMKSRSVELTRRKFMLDT